MTGRRDELAELRRGLWAGQRLVTLTGPGGVGKSWLARRAVAELRAAFDDGVCVVDVAGLPQPASLAQTLAWRLGLQLRARQVGVPDLVPSLADRHLLLVLDGTEHLLAEAARDVAGLLRGCPRLHVLATSRQRLGITGETVVTVPPLALPADPSSVSAAVAGRYDAVALFVERAAAVLPEFRLTDDNVRAVVALCMRLDGNPLAIELAAARSGVLAPQALLERLDDRYRLLTGTAAGVPGQLPSLRASVEASWDLCSEAEQLLWARLSVFPGDFELDAVEAVCSGDGLEETDVLDLVESLLDKSVLVREAEPVAVRYRLLQSLRAYGAERLGPNGRRRCAERHLSWTEHLALTVGRDWFGPRQTTLFHRLRREHADLAVGLDAATSQPAGAPRALLVLVALEPWWVVAGHVTDARHWLAVALRHGTGSAEERARAHALAAFLATLQGDLEDAHEALDSGSRIPGTRSADTFSAVARARGTLALARGDLGEAEASFRESVEQAVRGNVDAAAAEGWLWLGVTRGVAGRGDDAEQALRRCVAVAGRAGDSQVRASGLALQALGALEREEVSSASALAREAFRTKLEVGDGLAVASLLEVLAWVATADDDPARSALLLGAAERRWRNAGVPPGGVGPLVVGRDQRVAAVRAALGRRELERHRARGAALSWDEVVRFAEGDPLPRQRQHRTSTPLTVRETAVAELVARGLTNREIAAALVISLRTVQGHVEHILRKLDVGSRAQVAAWVAQREVGSTP